jgi:hypothetical protein
MTRPQQDPELVIQDIITRYGETIDLRERPHIILEILRNYAGEIVNVPDGGVSVAGVGSPPPGPSGGGGSLGNVVDNAEIMKEILKLSRQVHRLTESVERLERQ